MQSRSDFAWEPLNVTQTTLVHTGPGALHTIVVNQLDQEETVTIYDGVDATGTLRGTIVADAATSTPVTLTYDAMFTVGLYIVVAGQGTTDLTVNYI